MTLSDDNHDIAIIGMAGRFPGARNVDEFWANLVRGEESIRRLTDEELVRAGVADRKSTRLNSSHLDLSRMPSSA